MKTGFESTLSKFVENTKLGGSIDLLVGTEAFTGLDILEHWSITTNLRRASDMSSNRMVGKSFSIDSVAGYWNRLPREVVMAPSLLVFKMYLANTLRYIV